MREEKQKVKPLVSHTIRVPNGESERNLTFKAACFAGASGHLSHYKTPKTLLTIDHGKKTCFAFHSIGATCVFAPNPTKSNAQIIPHGSLDRVLVLGEGAHIGNKTVLQTGHSFP